MIIAPCTPYAYSQNTQGTPVLPPLSFERLRRACLLHGLHPSMPDIESSKLTFQTGSRTPHHLVQLYAGSLPSAYSCRLLGAPRTYLTVTASSHASCSQHSVATLRWPSSVPSALHRVSIHIPLHQHSLLDQQAVICTCQAQKRQPWDLAWGLCCA